MRAVRCVCLSALVVGAILWLGFSSQPSDLRAADSPSAHQSGSFDSKPSPPAPEQIVVARNSAVAPTAAKTLPASKFIHSSPSPINPHVIKETTARARSSPHLRDIPLLI